MTEIKREVGQVYAHNYGYSICAYEFFLFLFGYNLGFPCNAAHFLTSVLFKFQFL